MQVPRQMRRDPRDWTSLNKIRHYERMLRIWVYIHVILVAILKIRMGVCFAAKIAIYFVGYFLKIRLVYLYKLFGFQRSMMFECIWLSTNIIVLDLMNSGCRCSIDDLRRYRKVMIIGLIPMLGIHVISLNFDSLIQVKTLEVDKLFSALYYCYISGAIMTDLLIIYFLKKLMKLKEVNPLQRFLDYRFD